MRGGLLVAWLVLQPACIIGTWPEPEERDDDTNDQAANASGATQEACDSVDNDADGSTDEGCACDAGTVLGCVGVLDGACGLGVQWCDGGLRGVCADVGPPWSPLRQPRLEIISVLPSTVVANSLAPIEVTVAVVTHCAAVPVPGVEVRVIATDAGLSVAATRADDGTLSDTEGFDGLVGVELPNVFGAGAGAQQLRVRASARLNGQAREHELAVPLEVP